MYNARSCGVSWGCDTSEVLNAAKGKTIFDFGFKWVVRTLSCTAAELEALTAAGLGVMLYQASRASGWSAATGTTDGTAAAKEALAIGYPDTCTLFIDLSPGPVADLTAYVNAWAEAAVAAGMAPGTIGLYCEPGVALTGAELYALPGVSHYWKCGGEANEPRPRSWQMFQEYPGNYVIAPGVVVDADATWSDWEGGHPVAAFAPPTAVST